MRPPNAGDRARPLDPAVDVGAVSPKTPKEGGCTGPGRGDAMQGMRCRALAAGIALAAWGSGSGAAAQPARSGLALRPAQGARALDRPDVAGADPRGRLADAPRSRALARRLALRRVPLEEIGAEAGGGDAGARPGGPRRSGSARSSPPCSSSINAERGAVIAGIGRYAHHQAAQLTERIEERAARARQARRRT